MKKKTDATIKHVDHRRKGSLHGAHPCTWNNGVLYALPSLLCIYLLRTEFQLERRHDGGPRHEITTRVVRLLFPVASSFAEDMAQTHLPLDKPLLA